MERARLGFRKIRREHVELACVEILSENGAMSIGSYFVRFRERELPAKLVLKKAYRFANGVEIPATAFSGGTYTARILESLEFQVVVRRRVERSSTQTTEPSNVTK